jgi:hypothetical protein
MDFGELLCELRENILHDRSDQVAGASDYLWSDTTLLRYIDQAQRRFARKSLCIRDFTTPQCCQIKTVVGQIYYPLDPSVVAVISAKFTGDNADLARAGHSAFSTYTMPDPYYFDPSQLSQLPPGKPLAYGTDEGVTATGRGSQSVMNLRIYPAPLAAYSGVIINMRVCRTPIVRCKADNLTATPEIPEDYQLDMLDWAAYLALRIDDKDMGDPERAQAYKNSFAEHCEEVRREMLRKFFTPMQWGFGRNGFSWERDGEGY